MTRRPRRDSILPVDAPVMSAELTRVDSLFDDPVFFAPFVPCFDPRYGRPSIPMETYLRFTVSEVPPPGYGTLCREVTDSISWQRFARIPLGTRVPHPATLMKITTKCGDATARQRSCCG